MKTKKWEDLKFNRIPIAIGISKKDIPKVKKGLKEAGYSEFIVIKHNRYFDIYYTKYKKPK
jgi:hypothetical protein